MLIATTIRHALSIVVICLLLFVDVGSAAAQDAASDRQGSGAPRGSLQMGILWVRPMFRIPEFGVDTNVYNEAGERKPDFVVVVQPGLDLGVATRRFDMVVTPHVNLVHYRQAASERSANPAVAVKAERRFSSRVALGADGAIGTSRERIGPEIDARALRFSQGVTVNARLASSRTRYELHASEAETRYDAGAELAGVSLAQELNRSSRGIGLLAGYRLSSFTTAVASADVTTDRFLHNTARDFDALRVTGGFELKPRALLSGSIRAGYKIARPLRDVSPKYAGAVASGGLALKIRDAFSIAGGVERDLDYSYRPDRPYFVYNLYEGSVHQALLRYLDLGVGIASTKLNYRLFGPPGSPEAATRFYDYLVNTSASVGIMLPRGLRFGIYAARWERFSGGTSSRSDRFGFQLSTGRANVNQRGVFINGPGR